MVAPDAAGIWAALRPDAQGLVAAIVQHPTTGQVLMLGYMNADALAATLETGRVTFWSRSRSELWEKGATSGNTLECQGIRVDCDGDALLVSAAPAGPTCHTGTTSCFFRPIFSGDGPGTLRSADEDDGPPPSPDTTLAQVFETILQRKAGRGATAADGRSYVRSLLERGVPKISEKIEEEAGELVEALAGESAERVASEAADLLFHAMVGLAARDVDLREVAEVLGSRMGISGLDEKASRSDSPA